MILAVVRSAAVRRSLSVRSPAFRRSLLVVSVLSAAAGCIAYKSPGTNQALVHGDVDLTLVQSRSAKAVTKLEHSNSNAVDAASSAAPQGGATVSLPASGPAGAPAAAPPTNNVPVAAL